MRAIKIGRSGRESISIDLTTLLKTRALIQAGSGGGKSYFLRRLAEQLFGKVQTFIIDREGEFSSLREKYGFVLAGQGGDTAVSVGTARALAEKLLELRASAVCDLYEAFRKTPSARRAWVRGFLEGIMDAPKKFWRPLVVIVDEAHLFCPQESPKAASMIEREIISGCKDAMVSLATAGRKRKFCAVWATQRLAKLDKDASAELLNRFVGQTIEDVDVDRAADLMSVSRDEKAGFKKDIKNLEPGNFFGFGRAVSKNRILIRIGPVKTTHEAVSTKYASAPPPAPEKIRGLLPKLKDFPAEVEQKAKNEAELRSEVQTLKNQIKVLEKKRPAPIPPKLAKPVTTVQKVEVPVISTKEIMRLERAMARADAAAAKVQNEVPNLRGFSDKIRETLRKFEQIKRGLNTAPPPPRVGPATRAARPAPAPRPSANGGNGVPLNTAERGILKVLAQYPDDGCVIGKIALLARYRITGGFRNALSSLRSKKLIVGQNLEVMTITQAGFDALGSDYEPLPEGDDLVAHWLKHPSFGSCHKKIIETLRENDEGLDLAELAEESGYAITGGFRNALSALRTAGVMVGKNTERMKLSEALAG